MSAAAGTLSDVPDHATTAPEPAPREGGKTAAARAALGTRWHVAVIAGPDPGWCHPVRARATILGRSDECDLALDDPALSRRHLAVRERCSWVEIRDLGSVNGTWRRRVGRRHVRRVGRRWSRVPHGAEVLAGRSVLRFRPRPGLTGPHTGARHQDEDWPRQDRSSAGIAGPGRALTALLMVAWTLPVLLTSGVSGVRLALYLVPVSLLLAAPLWPAVRRAARARRSTPGLVGSAGSADPGARDPAAVLLASLSAPPPIREPTVLLATGIRLDPFAEGPLAIVGRPDLARSAARWLVCQLLAALGPDLVVRVVGPEGSGHTQWEWLDVPSGSTALTVPRSGGGAAPEPGALPAGPERSLVVVDALDDDRAVTDHRPGDRAASRRPSAPGDAGQAPPIAEVVLVPYLGRVPPRCPRVVEAAEDDPHLVSSRWAHAMVTALRSAQESTALGRVPTDVPLAPLLADPMLAWPGHDGRLSATFAVDADGPFPVDLAREGPHALVAGTTGSGKSELLIGWVLALACAYPPSALTMVAIDYKGGATFTPLAGLPHMSGVHTDLDGPGTTRALAGLRAELARRERAFAAAGVRDLAEYRRRTEAECRSAGGRDPAGRRLRTGSVPLGRLLVIVDEFRVLADEHPDLLAGLARLAAQGRSLGMHLVLATQRPAGAIGQDIRANIGLAICLRVVGSVDSLDVIGSADAALLPAVPGRAVVVGESKRQVQAAWCGSDPDTVIGATLARMTAAAHALGEATARPLWAPALPTRASAPEPADDGGDHSDDTEDTDREAGQPGCADTGESTRARARRQAGGPAISSVPILLVDRIEEQRLETWRWPFAAGPLVVAGGPRTGRSTTLATVAAGALAGGRVVHVVGKATGALMEHPRLGTVVAPTDPHRLWRLLDILADDPHEAVLCLDDADAVLAAAGPRGWEAIDRLALGRSRGLALAVAGPLSVLSTRWSAGARYRVVLGHLDPAQAAVAGVPRSFVPDRPPPGRGVLLGDGPPLLGHVLLPRTPAGDPAPAGTPSGVAPVRLVPLPNTVTPADVAHPAPTPWSVPLGLGGDDAAVVWLDARPGLRMVVAGPPESGRTTALTWMADRLTALGASVGRIDPTLGAPRDMAINSPVLVVDDAESLPSGAADAVTDRWSQPGGVVIAAARSDTLATSFRGLPAFLKEARCAVVLAPLRGGTGHLPPASILRHADPAAAALPGRGVLVEPRRTCPVQLVSP